MARRARRFLRAVKAPPVKTSPARKRASGLKLKARIRARTGAGTRSPRPPGRRRRRRLRTRRRPHDREPRRADWRARSRGGPARPAGDDAFLSVSDDAGSAEAAAARATNAVGAFRAWREVSSTGPIRKATLDTVHRMRADANAEENANATTRRAARFGVDALADRTASTHTIASGIVTRPGRRNPRLPVVSSTWSRRRSRGGGAGTRRTPTGARRARTSSPRASPRGAAALANRGRLGFARPVSPSSDSSDVWMSAGAAMSTPGSVASGAVASRPPASPRFESARSRGARASATPRCTSLPRLPRKNPSPPRPRAPARQRRRHPPPPGSLSSEVSEDASPGALDRVADAFVLDDAKSPGPMGPVLREPKTNARAVSKTNSTVYTLSPTSPLVGNEARRLERLSQRLALERVRGVGRPVNVVGRIAETVVPAGKPREQARRRRRRGRARRLRHRRARAFERSRRRRLRRADASARGAACGGKANV